jgi:hypothetical protein
MGQADQIIKEADVIQASVTSDFYCKRTELCLYFGKQKIFS